MESLISSIWNFDGLINSALIFVTFGLLGVFLWKRAGSAYSLLNRLWEFCLGGKTFHDGKINAYFNERNDVERFNVLFNVGARNKEEIKSLINWTEWKLDKKQCESEDFDKTVFSEKAGISVRSVDRICENFSSGSLSDTLNNIIKNQKLAWVLAIYPFIFTIICFFSLLRRGAASKLYNEVHNSQN